MSHAIFLYPLNAPFHPFIQLTSIVRYNGPWRYKSDKNPVWNLKAFPVTGKTDDKIIANPVILITILYRKFIHIKVVEIKIE